MDALLSVEVDILFSPQPSGPEYENRVPQPATSLTPQGVVEPSRFSRSGESSAKTTTETAQEISNAERKVTLVMRVERPYEGFMFMFFCCRGE